MSTPHATATPSTPTPDAAKKRGPGGRFAPGNPGGPGNPFGRRIGALRRAFMSIVTRDDMRTIAAALVKLARDGEIPAARLVLQYTLGKPAAAVEPDRLEVDEYRLMKESAIPMGEWMETMTGIHASSVNNLTDNIWPLMEKETIRPLSEPILKAFADADKAELNKKAAKKAKYRELRKQGRQGSPSPNGSDGDAAKTSIVGAENDRSEGKGPSRAG